MEARLAKNSREGGLSAWQDSRALDNGEAQCRMLHGRGSDGRAMVQIRGKQRREATREFSVVAA